MTTINEESSVSVIILAAGKGTRMKSSKAKVLHEVGYRPMLHHVIEATRGLHCRQTLVVVGHQEDEVRKSLHGFEITTVRQEEQKGTGHAVQVTQTALVQDEGQVMILCGDSPLVRTESLVEMLYQHRRNKAKVTVMTTHLTNPTGYGRIITKDNTIQSIVEEKDASDEQKKVNEINGGIYIVEQAHLFQALAHLSPDNAQGEYYLTDIVAYSVKSQIPVHRYFTSEAQEILGVNSRVELEAAHMAMRKRRNLQLMQQGISMINADSIEVSFSSQLGCDCTLHQNVQIRGASTIGTSCQIGDGAIIDNCHLADNVVVGAYCYLADCEIGPDTVIAPYTVQQG